jgi:hypothetical protein
LTLVVLAIGLLALGWQTRVTPAAAITCPTGFIPVVIHVPGPNGEDVSVETCVAISPSPVPTQRTKAPDQPDFVTPTPFPTKTPIPPSPTAAPATATATATPVVSTAGVTAVGTSQVRPPNTGDAGLQTIQRGGEPLALVLLAGLPLAAVFGARRLWRQRS